MKLYKCNECEAVLIEAEINRDDADNIICSNCFIEPIRRDYYECYE